MLQVDSVNVLAARPLHAAVLPDGPLRRRRCSTGPRSGRAAPDGGVLGPRPGADARRPVAGDAAPDGPSYRAQRGKWGIVAEAPGAGGDPAGRGPRPRGLAPPGTSTTGCRAAKEHWGWNWSDTRRVLDYLYTVGDLAIAGPQQPVRGALRPARAGDPGRGAGRARPRRSPRPTASWCAGPRARTASPPPAACATTTGCTSSTCGRDRRAGRGRRAGPGRDRRLEPAGVPPPRRPAAAPRSTPGRCSAPSTRVVWERERAERLFDFRYRIEIYVPAAQARARLLRAAVPARRPDRRPASTSRPTAQAGRLLVKAAYAEPGAPPETAEELAAELRAARRLAAAWTRSPWSSRGATSRRAALLRLGVRGCRCAG